MARHEERRLGRRTPGPVHREVAGPNSPGAGLQSADQHNRYFFATLASVVGYKLPDEAATDSFDMLPAMLGSQDTEESIRPHLLTQSFRGEFQLRQGKWKYCDHAGSGGNNYDRGNLMKYALPETAPDAPGQLYDLESDPGETTNLYFNQEAKRKQLKSLLEQLKSSGRSAPRNRIPVGIENIPRLPE